VLIGLNFLTSKLSLSFSFLARKNAGGGVVIKRREKEITLIKRPFTLKNQRGIKSHYKL
jgi:hypothetical protein